MSSFWEEFKDLFKTDEQKSKEKQDKVNSALDAEKDVVEKLKQLEEEYNASLPKEEEYDLEKLFPSDSGLREVEYTPKSDNELQQEAEREINAKKQSDQMSVEEKYLSAQKALEGNKTQAEKSLKQGYEELAKLYGELKDKAQKDAIARGLARSSILTSNIESIDRAQAEDTLQTERDYRTAIENIENDIDELNRKRETALEQLDLKYASDIEKRINELKKDRDKTILQYEKYNNSVREKNAKYSAEREENIAEFLEEKQKEKLQGEKDRIAYEKKYGYSGEKQENYVKRYQIAYEFYTSLSPDIAFAALQASPNMKYYLGEYYNKLYSTLKAASNQKEQKRYF